MAKKKLSDILKQLGIVGFSKLAKTQLKISSYPNKSKWYICWGLFSAAE